MYAHNAILPYFDLHDLHGHKIKQEDDNLTLTTTFIYLFISNFIFVVLGAS